LSAILNRYPKYKESGIAWLGEVPEHWACKKLRSVAKSSNTRGRQDLPLLSVVREKGVTKRNTLDREENHNYIPDDLSNYKVVREGQLAMNKMKAWQGSYGISKYDGIVSPAYFVFDINGVEKRFFSIAIRSKAYIPFFTQASDGIRVGQWDLSLDRMKEIPFTIPPPEEQLSIARFLDHKTALIDRYIRQKKRMIALLEEQKRVIIDEAVTGKIDVRTGKPYPKYKDSGVEWLGMVPEGWAITPLARLIIKIDQGWSPSASEGPLQSGQWAVCSLSAIKHGKFDPEAIKPIPSLLYDLSRIELHDNDFLLTRANTRNLVGDVCIVANVRPKSIISDLIYRFQLDKTAVFSGFLLFQMLSPYGRQQIEVDARGSSSTMPKISQGHIKRWQVILPGFHEQESISKYLKRTIGRIDNTIGHNTRQIVLTSEYRSRLISEVVTGKLDVRAAAADLLDFEATIDDAPDEALDEDEAELEEAEE